MIYIIDCSISETLGEVSKLHFVNSCISNFSYCLEESILVPQLERRIVKKFNKIWLKENCRYSMFNNLYSISFLEFYKSLPLKYRFKKILSFYKCVSDFVVLSFNKDEINYLKQFEYSIIDIYILEDLKQVADFNLKANDVGLFDYDEYNLFISFLKANIYNKYN